MKKLITNLLLILSFVLLAMPALAKVDNSQDILRDQEIVTGDIIDTGVTYYGKPILIDASINQIVNW